MGLVTNGVRYVPAIEANSNMQAIARGLIADFWGSVKDCELEEKMSGLTVQVYDDGKGTPVEEIIANIAKKLGEA